MNFDTPFMPWIDHLPEVGDPIRRERAKLLELAEQAAELERHAAAVRALVQSGQAELMTKVMKHWTLADIQSAAQAADRLDPAARARAEVDDTPLRERLQQFDGWQLASEALTTFQAARVIRQEDLLTSATDAERRRTLERVLAWWDHAARPVCRRLAVKSR